MTRPQVSRLLKWVAAAQNALRNVGIEAQLRWRRPGLGTVPATEFLGVVDQLGLHEQIGTWMLSAACRQLEELLSAGRQLWLVVNASTAHLASTGFPLECFGTGAARFGLTSGSRGMTAASRRTPQYSNR